MKLLLIEDDPDLREVIRRSLEKERYLVETAADYASARQKLFVYQYDVVLLDINLPDGSGLDLLREIQRRGMQAASVIVISARDSIDDKVEGLDLGADDYLAKPFHLAELHARIKSLLRRGRKGGDRLIGVGNVSLDPDKLEVLVAGRRVEVSRKEFDILSYFMLRPCRLVEKETLAEAVWGDDIDQTDNFDFIYAQMKNLRKKLKEASATIEIKTIYRFGYKLVET